MGLELGKEEVKILQAIARLNDVGLKEAEYYKVCKETEIATNKMISMIWRLEEENYIYSDGLIYRYLHLSDKGKMLLQKQNI